MLKRSLEQSKVNFPSSLKVLSFFEKSQRQFICIYSSSWNNSVSVSSIKHLFSAPVNFRHIHNSLFVYSIKGTAAVFAARIMNLKKHARAGGQQKALLTKMAGIYKQGRSSSIGAMAFLMLLIYMIS